MMKKFFRAHGFAAVFSVLLAVFTLYAFLDTFVISREFAKAKDNDDVLESYKKEDGEPERGYHPDPVIASVFDRGVPDEPERTDTSYYDGEIYVNIEEYEVNDTAVYAAEVALRDPAYFRAGLAEGTYGRNISEKTSMIAAPLRSIFAVNGDFYGARNSGYVLRNGTLYRNASSGTDDLVVWGDGSFEIVNERDASAEELAERGAWQIFSFGPSLVENGEVVVSETEEVRSSLASNPRTAVGQLGYLHYLFVVSDGRTYRSPGLTLYELAGFMKEHGAVIAYNLDGGGSSTMVFGVRVINNPTDDGYDFEEREVSDIVYIGRPRTNDAR